MNPISIFIIDDHRLVRETWSSVLSADSRFYVLGQASAPLEAIPQIKLTFPNVVLTDINMLPVDGFEATKLILACSPKTAIIGVSVHTNPAIAKKLFSCGAKGFVTKNSSKEEMFKAILAVSEERTYICKEIKNAFSLDWMEGGKNAIALSSVTHREREIIKLIKNGYSSKEIADELGLSVKTVEVHRYNILKKLTLKNTAALVNYVNDNVLY